ncbi:MAG: hypothetical protein RH917_16505 [Lacipirellulaceae bacterium]
MFLKKITIAASAVLMLTCTANAQVIIDGLDIRGTGIFGFGDQGSHQTNVTASSYNGGAFPGAPRTPNDPIDVTITYPGLDLDGDATANDEVTFTVRWQKVDFDNDGNEGGFLASFGQGMDTGFGSLGDMQVSVIGVTGKTTDSDDFIVFDGFTGATLGAGGNTGGIDRNAEVNGTLISFTAAETGAFQFFTESIDFAPTPILEIGNSGDSDFDGMGDGGAGSIVARAYDFQFSTSEVDPGVDGDFDGDLDVDGADFLGYQVNDSTQIPTWEANYGTGTSPPAIASVPEPSSLLICVLGGVAALSTTRRRGC